jgi:hypothetical protein
MDTETIGAENTLQKQKAARKPGRPPPIMMTATTNFIRLQSDFKDHVKENTSSEIHEMEPVS